MVESQNHVIKFDADMTAFLQKIAKGESATNQWVSSLNKHGANISKVYGKAGTSFSQVGKYNAGTKQIENLGREVARTAQKVKLADGTVGNYITTTKRMKDGTSQVTAEFKRASGVTEGYGEAMNRLFKRAIVTIPVWLLLRSTLMAFGQLLKSSVKFLVDWEYQLAQIAIVGNSTKEQLSALSGALIQVAKDFGISHKELGESAKLWAQQGRAIEEIIPLMRTTAQLSLLTGQTTTKVVEDLTAVLKAYRIEAKNSITIVDSMTNVMLNHAITAGDLASAYKQVASTASSLGVSFEELTGYITAIKAVTRDSGSKIGLSLRTMFSRITTSSADAIQNLSSVPLYLDSAGRATFAVTPRMRQLGDIISELSLKFNDLGSAQKSQLASLIGGVRRQNQVFALFDNFTESIKAQTDALFGLGKSSKAIETLTNTAKIGIDKLKNSWFSFVESVANSEVIKATINTLIGLISTLDRLLASNKHRYKESLDLLNKENDELARQIKYADGVAQVKQTILNLENQSLRATTKNKETLDEMANTYRKQVNDASKQQGIEFMVAEDTGLAGLTEELKQLSVESEKLKLGAIVGQDINEMKTQVLSAGQSIGMMFDEFNKYATRTASSRYQFSEKGLGEIRRDSKELYSTIVNISQLVRKGVVIPDEAVNKIKSLTKEYGNFTDEQQSALSSLLESYQEKNALLNDSAKVEENTIKRLETQKKYQEDIVLEYSKQQTIAKAVLADELERMKISGALTSEILKAEGYRKGQLGIEDTITERINRQLALQREINKEKRLQNKLSSDSMKLFDIAQSDGVDIAKQIGDVLSGEMDFDMFVRRGGEAVEIFKDKFSDVFKQQQAMQFFKGDVVSGMPGLRGGYGIDIAEGDGLRTPVKRFSAEAENLKNRIATQERDYTMGKPAVQNNITVPVDVGVNVSIDPSNLKEMQDQVEDRIAKSLPEVGSKVNQGLAKALYNKQTRSI